MKKFIISLLVGSLALGASAADTDENPIATVSQLPGYCTIFHQWGFIGDSLCSGEHESLDEQGHKGYHDYYDYSWGQRICRACGTEGQNFSQGGETAKGWIQHFWDTTNNRNANVSAKHNPKQAYIIALGVNDRNTGIAPGDTRSDVNIDDFTKNAPTFAGYYGGIIQRIKSIQPEAKIFVVTRPRDGVDDTYNVPVRQMAEIFSNVYVIDLYKYAPDYSKGSDFARKFMLGGHLNAAGYQYTAWMFMTYIDWIVRNNMDDFAQVGFIGTGLRYNAPNQ